MRFLLDTHTLLWIVSGDKKLSQLAKQTYLNTKNQILFSIGSIWEIAIKISRSLLEINEPFNDFIENQIFSNDIQILNISVDHLIQLEKLPFHHSDPFDRLIIAQSMVEDITIIGTDKQFDLYPVKRLW